MTDRPDDALARTTLPEETVLAERHIEAINRFPDQNPNPVMRMTDDGVLVYANVASQPITNQLGITVGDPLPAATLAALRSSGSRPVELRTESDGTFAVLAVPVPELGFVNLYGTDITAAKAIDRFPGSNPNPVLRTSKSGELLYANDASGLICQALAVAPGEMLPPELFARLLAVADERSTEAIEVGSSGHTYRLTPVHIPEFGFINIYGTDVTAVKALDKFPDQNPNPVMRVSHEGLVLYANPASAPIREALGVQVGQVLPAATLKDVLERLESGSRRPFEVDAGGQLFAVLVAAIYEFGFINLYGTDITAARAIERANAENERLLLNVLPESIATRLRAGERLIADRFDSATLMFADIVGFTGLSARMTPAEVVDILNQVFSVFDDLVDRFGLEKVKTIGDAYMVVGGIPEPTSDHCHRVADMAIALCAAVLRMDRPEITFRVGIDTGPVVAGIIGSKKFIYDVWGNTVNTASRMESHGTAGLIQVTEAVHDVLADDFVLQDRGVIDVRGRGPMRTWYLLGRQGTRLLDLPIDAATLAASLRRGSAP